MARRRTHFVRPPKKTMVWLGGTPSQSSTAIAANTAVLLSTLNAAALTLRPFTVLRTRGFVAVATDQTAATEKPFGIYSQIVVSDEALAAGIASIPEPFGEPDADFFVHQPFLNDILVTSAIGSMRGWTTFPFDSKAMRKVGNNDTIVTVGSNVAASHGIEIIVVSRRLVQLH